MLDWVVVCEPHTPLTACRICISVYVANMFPLLCRWLTKVQNVTILGCASPAAFSEALQLQLTSTQFGNNNNTTLTKLTLRRDGKQIFVPESLPAFK